MKRSFQPPKHPSAPSQKAFNFGTATTSKFGTATTTTTTTTTTQKEKKKKRKTIKDVPSMITDSYVECLQTPQESELASPTLEKFLLVCRENSSSLLGCVRHLCKAATSEEIAWDLRIRSVQMLHSLLLRSVSCREEFSGGGDPSHCLRLIECAVSGVGVEDSSNTSQGVDVSQKLVQQVTQLLTMLDEQFGSNPRFTVAKRLMEQRLSSSTTGSSARVGMVLGAGLARVSEQARGRQMELVREAVEKVDHEVEEVEKLVEEVNECFHMILPRLRNTSNGDGGGEGDDSDDDENVNWEDVDNDEYSEDESTLNRKNEVRAKKLLENLRNNHVVEINTLLSTEAGGFHDKEEEEKEEEEDAEKLGLREALEETLKSSLASLKKHRAKKINFWITAIREMQERGEGGEGDAAVLRGVLHKLVQAKSKLSELLGRAVEFEKELGGDYKILPPDSPRKKKKEREKEGTGGGSRGPMSRFDRKIKFSLIKRGFN